MINKVINFLVLSMALILMNGQVKAIDCESTAECPPGNICEQSGWGSGTCVVSHSQDVSQLEPMHCQTARDCLPWQTCQEVGGVNICQNVANADHEQSCSNDADCLENGRCLDGQCW